MMKTGFHDDVYLYYCVFCSFLLLYVFVLTMLKMVENDADGKMLVMI